MDVLIAGAGPVGLSLACELQRRGVSYRIVDAAPTRMVVSRATDLHARSLELWDRTGIADGIVIAALPITGVPLFSHGRQVARLDFGGVDSVFPAAVSLPQHDLEDMLCAFLDGRVERGNAVEILRQDDECVSVRIGDEACEVRYLVACDGVHSGLRNALDIPFDGAEYPGRWAVMDATVDGWPYGPGEIPVFLDADGFWAMPLPSGRLRLFFRDDDASEQPEVADAQAVIDRHVPGSAHIAHAENRACFRLHHRVARRFRVDRVFLAGDAAHAMTPVNGQGMNTGVQDVYNLAWKLERALAGASPEVLDSYEDERRPVAIATVQASGRLHEANVLTGDAAAERDLGLAAALATPAEVLAAVEAAHELGVGYPPSPIVGGIAQTGALGVQPGQRVPHVAPLREMLRETELQLWLCAGVNAARSTLDVAARFARCLPTKLFVIGDAPASCAADVVADPDLRVHGRLGALTDAAYVVRPDGYLGFRCDPPDADALAEHLGAFGLDAAAHRTS